MPAITFLALLNEGNKLDVYEKKMLITIASYPQMDEEKQEMVMHNLTLPDDVYDDILESETPDDISILKEALNGE